MGRFFGLLVLCLAAGIASRPAIAEPSESTLCRACPAISHINACSHPAGTVVRGRVTGFLKGKCSIIMSFEPLRASQQGLPARIGIDLGPCAVWSGKTNRIVSVAVLAPRTFNDPAYPLACQPQ